MKGLVAVMVLFAFSSCGDGGGSGGGNPQALCMQGTQALCDKVYDCAEGEPLRAFFGATKADCVTSLNSQGCTSTTGCPSGQTYHADMAQACLAAFQAITCAQLSDATAISPPACDMVCTGP